MPKPITIPLHHQSHTLADGWRLYHRHAGPTHSFLWLPFKLMLVDHAPRRWGVSRTYWFQWNPLECRFGRTGDVLRLKTERPALAFETETLLNIEYGPAYIQSRRTMDEIRAEIDRMAAARAARGIKR